MKEIIRYRHLTYLAGFLISLHLALTAYISSAWLGTILPESLVGLVFALASLILILITFNEKYAIAKYGDIRLTTILIILLVLASFVLAGNYHPLILVIAFIAFFALGAVIKFNLDLYLENLSNNQETGKIRGIFLTCINLAWLCSPFLAVTLIGPQNNYWKIYLIAGLALLPLLYLTGTKLRDWKRGRATSYHLESIRETLRQLSRGATERARNLFNILTIIFILNFFYATMVIYTSLYLLNHVGFDWAAIGKIFTVMLVPFVIIQYPLGRLADKLGEREVLMAGLFLMAGTTALVPLLQSSSLVVWSILLFSTRVGAAAVEIMSDVYLFKRASEQDINIIALARNCYPFSYIIAPLLATIFLIFFPLRWIFLALALIILIGLKYAYRLKDTN